MVTLTRAAWRGLVRDAAPDLTDKEVRDVAGLAHKRWESRFDDPGWRIRGITADPTPAEMVRSIFARNDMAAARRLGLAPRKDAA